MNFTADILADSLCETSRCRLTTWRLIYPLYIHNEHLRHRSFSFSVGSSRAQSWQRMSNRTREHPFVPEFYHNQLGMTAGAPLSPVEQVGASELWLSAMSHMLAYGDSLSLEDGLNVSKAICNRLLYAWQWVTVVCTGDHEAHANFFTLRAHRAAEPSFQRLAVMMVEAYHHSTPRLLESGDWHLPFISDEDDELSGLDQRRVAVARCARTSYEQPDGARDVAKDLDLHMRLRASDPPHASPFEHIARACDRAKRIRNFIGWEQWRVTVPNDTARKFDYETWKKSYYARP